MGTETVKRRVPKYADPYPEFRWCRICGWAKGGTDSWCGQACKCGYRFTLSAAK